MAWRCHEVQFRSPRSKNACVPNLKLNCLRRTDADNTCTCTQWWSTEVSGTTEETSIGVDRQHEMLFYQEPKLSTVGVFPPVDTEVRLHHLKLGAYPPLHHLQARVTICIQQEKWDGATWSFASDMPAIGHTTRLWPPVRHHHRKAHVTADQTNCAHASFV